VGSNLPVLKPKEVVAILEKFGFTLARQKGSHQQFRHRDGRDNSSDAWLEGFVAFVAKADLQRHQRLARRLYCQEVKTAH
jgi:hypothetical protein